MTTNAAFLPVVRAESATRKYGVGAAAVTALHDATLAVNPGEFIAVTGRSGCGKTTVLNLLGAMDVPTSGVIFLAGEDTSKLSDDALTRLRRHAVGFVFQAFHLLPTLTVRENVTLPLHLHGAADRSAVDKLLEQVELAHRAQAYPRELSGGEMQRAAIARALVHRPILILADEPTGNLDEQSAVVVLDLLSGLSRESGAAIVMATHSPEAASRADRTLRMRDGRILVL